MHHQTAEGRSVAYIMKILLLLHCKSSLIFTNDDDVLVASDTNTKIAQLVNTFVFNVNNKILFQYILFLSQLLFSESLVWKHSAITIIC